MTCGTMQGNGLTSLAICIDVKKTHDFKEGNVTIRSEI